MTNQEIRARLLSALTNYDRKQAGKRGYNPYALPQYLARLDEVMADIGRGAEMRAALVAAFTGRLADACLRAVSAAITTNDEARGGPIGYAPVVSVATRQYVRHEWIAQDEGEAICMHCGITESLFERKIIDAPMIEWDCESVKEMRRQEPVSRDASDGESVRTMLDCG